MNLFINFSSILIAIFMLFFGFKAIFKTQQLINFFINCMGNKNSKNAKRKIINDFIKMTEKRIYIVNVKFFGFIIILLSFWSIFLVIRNIMIRT